MKKIDKKLEKLKNKQLQSEERYRTMFKQSPIGIMIIDKAGNIIEVNQAMCQIRGANKLELEGSNIYETLIPAENIEIARENISRILAGEDIDFIAKGLHASGDIIFTRLKETKIKLPDGREGVLSMQIDVTESKKREEKIRFLRFHDKLTGLYNRDYGEEELDRLNVQRQHPVSLLMVDLNGLKLINDSCGHHCGDKILKKAAEVLQDSVREEDLVARWGGDEFIIALPQSDEEIARRIYKEIKKKCKETEIEDFPIYLSVGYAIKEKVDQDIYEILKIADNNMYKNKLSESKQAKNDIIKGLLAKLNKRYPGREEHIKRIKTLSQRLSAEIGLSDGDYKRLELLIEVHDIGEVSIDEEIFNKEGFLTENERDIVKEHPEIGYRIIAAVEKYLTIASEVLLIHERWDGKGYPSGLSRRQIPLLSRIVFLLDAYDTMTHSRPYMHSLNKKTALREIKEGAGKQFDPELVDVLLNLEQG